MNLLSSFSKSIRSSLCSAPFSTLPQKPVGANQSSISRASSQAFKSFRFQSRAYSSDKHLPTHSVKAQTSAGMDYLLIPLSMIGGWWTGSTISKIKEKRGHSRVDLHKTDDEIRGITVEQIKDSNIGTEEFIELVRRKIDLKDASFVVEVAKALEDEGRFRNVLPQTPEGRHLELFGEGGLYSTQVATYRKL